MLYHRIAVDAELLLPWRLLMELVLSTSLCTIHQRYPQFQGHRIKLHHGQTIFAIRTIVVGVTGG